MKIGLVCPYTLNPPGGVQEHILALAKSFKKRGHKVKIIAPDYPPSLRPTKIPLNTIFIGQGRKVNLNGTVSWIAFGLDYEPRVREVLEKERFDILHFHHPAVPTLSWFIWAHSQVTNIITVHRAGNLSLEEKALQLLFTPLIFTLSRRLHAKIAVSESAKRHGRQFFSGDYYLIPNGIDIGRFNPEGPKIKKFLNSPGQRRRINILFVGRLEERKGLIYLLKAFRRFQGSSRLIIVGEGPQREDLQAFVLEKKIPEVYFESHVSPQKLPTYYRTADIFCAPATHSESFGIVLLEAMASGLPIVASLNPGYREVLKDYPLSPLAPKNITLLAETLEKLAEDRRLRKKLKKFGLMRAKKYSWEKIADQVLEVYQKAQLAKKRSPLLTLLEDFGLKDQLTQIFTQIRRFASLLE